MTQLRVSVLTPRSCRSGIANTNTHSFNHRSASALQVYRPSRVRRQANLSETHTLALAGRLRSEHTDALDHMSRSSIHEAAALRIKPAQKPLGLECTGVGRYTRRIREPADFHVIPHKHDAAIIPFSSSLPIDGVCKPRPEGSRVLSNLRLRRSVKPRRYLKQ